MSAVTLVLTEDAPQSTLAVLIDGSPLLLTGETVRVEPKRDGVTTVWVPLLAETFSVVTSAEGEEPRASFSVAGCDPAKR